MEYNIEDTRFQDIIIQSATASRTGPVTAELIYHVLNGFCLIYSNKPFPQEALKFLNDPFTINNIIAAYKWAQMRLEKDMAVIIVTSSENKFIKAV